MKKLLLISFGIVFSFNSFADGTYLNIFESKLNRTFKIISPSVALENNPYIIQIKINKLGSVLSIKNIPSGKNTDTEKYYIKSIFTASPYHPLAKHFPNVNNSITIEATFKPKGNKPIISGVKLLNAD